MPIWMHNGVATGFVVSTKNKVGKEPFGDIIDWNCYGLTRNIAAYYGKDTI